MLLRKRVVAELGHRLLGDVAELLLSEVLQGCPDDLDVRRQRRQRKMRHARQQLAARQVAGCSEQHDHVRLDGIEADARTRTKGRISNGLNTVICHALMLPPSAPQQQDATPI